MTARNIAGWGDSNMAALGGTSASKLTTILGNRFGVTAFNGATSGDWSKHTAADMNALPALVTITNGTMPASGSVTCTISNIGTHGNNGTGFTGTLLGIACSISLNSATGVWTLTRTTAGTATAIPANTPLQSTAGLAHRDGELVIIWVGKNDANLTANLNDTAANIQACVDYLTGDYRYLVLGHFVDTAHTSPGAWSRERVFDLNDLLSAAHGANYVDISAYVASSQIWTDAGLTPNSTDLTAQTNLVLPPSLAADYGHLNTAGNNAVGKFVGDYIASLGWYDESGFWRGGAANGANGQSTSVTIPAGAQAGDIALAALAYNHGQIGDPATPTGWTQVSSADFSTSFRARLYSKVLASGEGGSTLTFTLPAGGSQKLAAAVGVIPEYVPGDGGSRKVTGVHVSAARVENLAASTTHTAASATASAEVLQVAFIAERESTPSTAFTAPSGFTLGAQFHHTGSGATSIGIAYSLTPANSWAASSTAPIGGGTWTEDVANDALVMFVVGVGVVHDCAETFRQSCDWDNRVGFAETMRVAIGWDNAEGTAETWRNAIGWGDHDTPGWIR